MSKQIAKMATESKLQQSQILSAESTNIKCIIWYQKLKQRNRFHAQSKGKVDCVFNSPGASEIAKKVSPMSSICKLYVFTFTNLKVTQSMFEK